MLPEELTDPDPARAVADCAATPCGNGLVPESDETNNGRTATTQITLVAADLVTTSVSGPSAAVAGDSIAVSTTVQNTVAGTQAQGLRVGVYLSTDPGLPGTGVLLGSRTINTLNGGATSEAVTMVTIPDGTAPGTYCLTAVADDQSHVTEADETNNGAAAATPITITAP